MLKDRSDSSSTAGAVLCVWTHTQASEPQQFSTFLNLFGQLLLYLHSNVKPESYSLNVYTYLANKAILTFVRCITLTVLQILPLTAKFVLWVYNIVHTLYSAENDITNKKNIHSAKKEDTYCTQL